MVGHAIQVGSISDEVERERSTLREKSNSIRLHLIKLRLRPVLVFFKYKNKCKFTPKLVAVKLSLTLV